MGEWMAFLKAGKIGILISLTGYFGEYSLPGILRGAGIVFFAFIGFDAVSTAAQDMGQSGVFYSMSKDGLLAEFFFDLSKKQTPSGLSPI